MSAIQDPLASPVSTAGFLYVSTSMGMFYSDPLVGTYVRHLPDRTLIVTMAEWTPNDGEYVTGRLRVLRQDGSVQQVCELAFEGDRTMPGMGADAILLPKGAGGARSLRETMLERCLAIGSSA